MKITIGDQLRIYKGEITPTDNSLKDLLAQLLLHEAHVLNDNGFTDVTDPLAVSYVQKMTQAVNQIISFQPQNHDKNLRYAVMALGDAFTLGIIEGLATDGDWVVKLNTVKLRIIELLAKVTLDEKAAYELP